MEAQNAPSVPDPVGNAPPARKTIKCALTGPNVILIALSTLISIVAVISFLYNQLSVTGIMVGILSIVVGMVVTLLTRHPAPLQFSRCAILLLAVGVVLPPVVGVGFGVTRPFHDGVPSPIARTTTTPPTLPDVYAGSLADGFSLNADTSNHQHDWVADQDGIVTLTYPADQLWGTAFIAVNGPTEAGSRPSLDVSKYRSLIVEMHAEINRQCVRLGIKDNVQPDDGSEITIRQCLTTQWSTIALPLNAFADVDLKHLYVVLEVAFQGSSAVTVEVRAVRYSPNDASLLPPPPILGTFAVYTDWGAPGNSFVPSGAMGDYGATQMKENWTDQPHSGTTCIQVMYSGATPQHIGWAGVYWQDPVNNWGKRWGPTGYDLSHLSKLSFWVRGASGGEKIEFKVGGIRGPYGDSLQPAVTTGVILLTTGWQYVSINLTGIDPTHPKGKNLTHIIGGFLWTASKEDNPHGATFYLDDIVYS